MLNSSFLVSNARQHEIRVDTQSAGRLGELCKVAEPDYAPATRWKRKGKFVLFYQGIYAYLDANTLLATKSIQISLTPNSQIISVIRTEWFTSQIAIQMS